LIQIKNTVSIFGKLTVFSSYKLTLFYEVKPLPTIFRDIWRKDLDGDEENCCGKFCRQYC
jgi:hypothetical protein